MTKRTTTLIAHYYNRKPFPIDQPQVKKVRISSLLGLIILVLQFNLAPRANGVGDPKHREIYDKPAEDVPGKEDAANNPDGEQNLFRPLLGPYTGGSKIVAQGNKNGCDRRLSLDSLTQIPEYRALEARGDTVYFDSNRRGVWQVYRSEPKARSPQPITFFPEGISAFTADPTGERLLVKRENAELFHVAKSHPEPVALALPAGLTVESFVWGVAPAEIFVTAYAKATEKFLLVRYDLKTRQAATLFESTDLIAVSDLSPDGKKIALVKYQSADTSEIVVGELDKNTFLVPAASKVPSSDQEPFFTADGANLFFLSDREKGRRQLFVIDLVKKTSRVVSEEPSEIQHVAWDTARATIAYDLNEGKTSRWKSFRIGANGNRLEWLTLPSPKDTLIQQLTVTSRGNERQWVTVRSNPNEAAAIWNWDGKKEGQLWEEDFAALKGKCPIAYQAVKIPSFDRQEIPAILYRREWAAPREPALILVHSGPSTQHRPFFDKSLYYWVNSGYSVLVPNYRGSNGYGREFSHLDDQKNRVDAARDLVASADWLQAGAVALPQKVGILGSDYGAFLALHAMALAPGKFRAGAFSEPLLDIKDLFAGLPSWLKGWKEKEFGSESFSLLGKGSPIAAVLLFESAEKPEANTATFIGQLQAAKVPVEYVGVLPREVASKAIPNAIHRIQKTAYFFEKLMK